MSGLLGWDTICHVCGVPMFTRFVDPEDFMDPHMAVVDKGL